MHLFKYCTQKTHAEALINNGIIHFRTADYFCKLEDDIRGDRHDGARILNSELTLKTDQGTEVIVTKCYSIRSQQEVRQAYIFCLSKTLSHELKERFKATVCVRIIDVEKFIAKMLSIPKIVIQKTLVVPLANSEATEDMPFTIEYEVEIFHQDIIYPDENIIHKEIVSRGGPGEKYFHKRKGLFEMEDEYRFVLIPKKTIRFTCNSESLMNKVNTDKMFLSRIFPSGLNIEIGSLKGIAELVDCRSSIISNKDN